MEVNDETPQEATPPVDPGPEAEAAGEIAAAQAEPGAPVDRDGWRAAGRAELGRAAVPRVLQIVAELPLRGIGKPDRRAVSRLLATEPPPPPAG